jgi:hypothetical protein
VFAVHLLDSRGQVVVRRRIRRVERQVVQPASQPVDNGRVAPAIVAAAELLRRATPELVVGDRRSRDADDGEVVREQSRLAQVVQRGQQLAPGEISGRAEDHHRAGRRRRRLAIVDLLGRRRTLSEDLCHG